MSGKLKPRHMWADPLDLPDDGFSNLRLARKIGMPPTRHATVPVVVIPLDDVDALVEKAAIAFFSDTRTGKIAARNALTAIGVLPKSRVKKGRK